MTVEMRIECLKSFQEFESVRDDWDAFMERCFPENYARTHVWLSAWWSTYHAGQSALVYIQRQISDGRIVAAAPLYICRDNYGGFPVRSVVCLGKGLGTDDFLVSGDSSCFVEYVIRHLVDNANWDIAIFRRIGTTNSLNVITEAAEKYRCSIESCVGDEYVINIDEGFDAYFKGLSKGFRQNIRTALNRMKKAGTVNTVILNPVRDILKVIDVGMEIAKTSWQYKEGKSHFNASSAGSFYQNLANQDVAEGLEFNVLYLNEIPVSYLLGFYRRDIYYVIDIAFHSEYKFYSTGHVLYIKVIERLFNENKIKQIDLEGGGVYKDYFATGSRNAYFLTLFNRTAYSVIIRWLRSSRLYRLIKKRWG